MIFILFITECSTNIHYQHESEPFTHFNADKVIKSPTFTATYQIRSPEFPRQWITYYKTFHFTLTTNLTTHFVYRTHSLMYDYSLLTIALLWVEYFCHNTELFTVSDWKHARCHAFVVAVKKNIMTNSVKTTRNKLHQTYSSVVNSMSITADGVLHFNSMDY